MTDGLLTTAQIAEALGVDRTTVHRRIYAAGIRPAFLAGRTRLFHPTVVDTLRGATKP